MGDCRSPGRRIYVVIKAWVLGGGGGVGVAEGVDAIHRVGTPLLCLYH